ncbi:ribose-phosphate diphosphokinase [Candidatus Bathyarchaeota archaeon]|nr:ribose-phosphate diphosphokinase [Candidatus Bathyarchaeota archaeon]
MILLSGPASIELGRKIGVELGIPAEPVEHRIFPDGESYIRVAVDVRGETTVIIQTTSPPQDRHLIQLLLMARTVKDLGAKRVLCVVPYLAYARQDKRFMEGEALSLEVILRLLENSGVEGLVVVDVHNEDSLRELRGGMEVWNISAIPLLARYLRGLGYSGALSISPDTGALGLARLADQELGGGFRAFQKRRDRKTGDIMMWAEDLDVYGRDAAVFDDMVSTGGTTARAVAILKSLGARRVAAACTHALFLGDAERRIKEAGADHILATDTIPTHLSTVSVAKLIADHLKTIKL